MNEEDHQRAVALIPELISRLEFDIKNQPPDFLPAITQSIIILNGFLAGIGEISFQEVKSMLQDMRNRRNEGNQNGSNEKEKR